ncbi:MAG: substrate-binding domain-containing protein [Mycobacteriaceae bacterium]
MKPQARVLAVSVSVSASVAAVLALTACSSNTSPVGDSSIDGSTVAFLMPYRAPTGDEQNDLPGFEKKMDELCPSCVVLDSYAGGDAFVQHQQLTEALIQGAKVIVLDPVDAKNAGGLVTMAKSQGVKVIAYDWPIPTARADFYVSYDNEKIGALLAASLVAHLDKTGKDPAKGGILEVNGSPTDAAAGLVTKGIHTGLASGAYKTVAEHDTPESAPAKAQDWVRDQLLRLGPKILGVVAADDGLGGGAIAAAAATASIAFLKGEQPTSGTTLFDTPSRLFAPEVITADNIKARIFDTGIATAAEVCTGAYQAPCATLGIS